MSAWVQVLVTAIVTIAASSGFWTYMLRKDVTRKASTRLLMGVAYEKLLSLGMYYIDRGWITKDEFEDFRKYFYEPYKELGGNGVVDRIMAGVSDLPLKYPTVFQNREIVNDQYQPRRAAHVE